MISMATLKTLPMRYNSQGVLGGMAGVYAQAIKAINQQHAHGTAARAIAERVSLADQADMLV
jgi:hypothetical protein